MARYDHSEIEDTSICIDCARAPELRVFIEKESGSAPRCGVCHRTDTKLSRSTAFPKLASLIRALVRLNYDEADYNGHLGGDDLEQLLKEDNPLIKHKRIYDDGEDCFYSFEHRIFEPVYHEYTEGITLFSGDPNQSLPLRALKSYKSPLLSNIEKRLEKENVFEVEEQCRKIISVIQNNIQGILRKGTSLFRARIGHNGRFVQEGENPFESQVVVLPYMKADIGAPPPTLATAGRLNRQGVSFLYLASDIETAVAELRPHPGHIVSAGSFLLSRDVRIADFGSASLLSLSASDEKLGLYHFCRSVDGEMGSPVVPEERSRYTAMQLIADLIRRQDLAV